MAGGVPWFEYGRCLLAGSVVRRKVGGWKGVMAGAELGGEYAGVPTMATELVGLSLMGTWRAEPCGEVVFRDAAVCRPLRNCWRASIPARWPWSD
jgi:hypothetical protein